MNNIEDLIKRGYFQQYQKGIPQKDKLRADLEEEGRLEVRKSRPKRKRRKLWLYSRNPGE